MNPAAQGDNALAKSEWPAAIQHFTRALVELPRAPIYYIKRSTAYSRVKPADGGPNSQAALHDAEIALALARERGKRELILTAQMRRGVALYQLERYGDAAYVFGIVQDKTGASAGAQDKENDMKAAMAQGSAARSAKNSYEQELPIWMMKVNGKLKKLEDGDEKKAVTVKEYPDDIKIPTAQELRKSLGPEGLGSKESEAAEKVAEDKGKEVKTPAPDSTKESLLDPAPGTSAPFTAGPSAPSSAAPIGNVRHEWYQSNDTVVVTLYVKGVPKDKVEVDLKTDSVSIEFPHPSGAEFSFTLDPLFAPIDPSSSRFSILSTKIEVVLHKKVSGQKWSSLEATSAAKLADRTTAASATPTTTIQTPSTSTVPTPTTTQGPTYPTSSRHGVKDWDKLASSLTSKKKSESKSKSKDKGKEKEKSAEGDAAEESDGAESVDSDYASGDPVDAFFKKLYANADPDTRRAMVKSYYESQGTALSTNWSEVGKGKVEVKPPSD